MLYGKYKRCVLFGLGSHNHHKKGFFHSHNSVKNIVKHMGKKVLVKNLNLPFVLKLDDNESQKMFDRVYIL